MHASVAERVPAARAVPDGDLHPCQDVYTSGLIRSGTGIAYSTDGRNFQWLGLALPAGPDGWDSYMTRVATVMSVSSGFVLFYDGGRDVQQRFGRRVDSLERRVLRGPWRVVVAGLTGQTKAMQTASPTATRESTYDTIPASSHTPSWTQRLLNTPLLIATHR
jgi:hypothetical protein